MKFVGLLLLHILAPVIAGIAFMVSAAAVGVSPDNALAVGMIVLLLAGIFSAIAAGIRSGEL